MIVQLKRMQPHSHCNFFPFFATCAMFQVSKHSDLSNINFSATKSFCLLSNTKFCLIILSKCLLTKK